MRGEKVKTAQIIKNNFKKRIEEMNDVLLGLWPNNLPGLIGTYSQVFEVLPTNKKTNTTQTTASLAEVKLQFFSHKSNWIHFL